MKKILLVNNQEAFLGRNKNLLNRAGFLILTATSANEALRVHREQPVDLIISLLEMPDMGGDTLCRLVRQDSGLRQVPFIMVCYETDGQLRRTSECGANGWVTKPVHPERLLEQVGRFLRIPTRRDYRATFSATVNGRAESLLFSGMTHNISVSGMLCETEARLNHDDLLTNLLVAFDAQPIDADGRVVRREARPDGRYHYGVQFTRLADESRSRIQQIIAAPGTEILPAPASDAPTPPPLRPPLPVAI